MCTAGARVFCSMRHAVVRWGKRREIKIKIEKQVGKNIARRKRSRRFFPLSRLAHAMRKWCLAQAAGYAGCWKLIHRIRGGEG